MIQTILVIGGTGMLGEPVVRSLLAAGFQVRLMTRSPAAARPRFHPQVEIVPGDVEDLPSLQAALTGCDGAHLNLRSSSDPNLERRGAENVAQLAATLGLQRLTYLSGASAYPQNAWYAGTKAKLEAEAALTGSGVPFTIFKATWFMEALRNFVRELGGKTRALHIGRHPFPYHWIAAEDYARMVAHAYALPEAACRSLTIFGPQALGMRQALQTYCRITHPQARIISMPIPVAQVFARLGRRQELQAALPFFRYMESVRESGDPTEANILLGAPAITLEEWSRAELQTQVG